MLTDLLPDPTPYYLAHHQRSGRALFRYREDAREWANEQTRFHHPDQQWSWSSGGDHGWDAQRLPDGSTAAHIYYLRLNDRLPESRFASYWQTEEDDFA